MKPACYKLCVAPSFFFFFRFSFIRMDVDIDAEYTGEAWSGILVRQEYTVFNT